MCEVIVFLALSLGNESTESSKRLFHALVYYGRVIFSGLTS